MNTNKKVQGKKMLELAKFKMIQCAQKVKFKRANLKAQNRQKIKDKHFKEGKK